MMNRLTLTLLACTMVAVAGKAEALSYHLADTADALPHRSEERDQAQRPGAELKGIFVLGVVVEDLSPPAAACGLNRDALASAASKIFADSGLRVVRDSDEDTYVYLNVITTTIPGGVCVSRYDAYLYTHTTAKLSYQDAPLLVQVSLIHEGGLAGGAAAGHGESVLRSLKLYVEQFAARIKRANQ